MYDVIRELSDERKEERFPLLGTDMAFAIWQVREPIRPTAAEVEMNRRLRSSMVRTYRLLNLAESHQMRHRDERLCELRTTPVFKGASAESEKVVATQSEGGCGVES